MQKRSLFNLLLRRWLDPHIVKVLRPTFETSDLDCDDQARRRWAPNQNFSLPGGRSPNGLVAHDSFSIASTGQMSIDLRPSHLINTERENRVQPATTPRRVVHSTPPVLAVAEYAARAAFVVSLTVSPFFKAILIRTKSFRGGGTALVAPFGMLRSLCLSCRTANRR
jgi:hypothetical protein